jgi:hypothetical protein
VKDQAGDSLFGLLLFEGHLLANGIVQVVVELGLVADSVRWNFLSLELWGLSKKAEWNTIRVFFVIVCV